VAAYYEEAGREGLRADIVLCQAIKETGFFNYGGDVLPSQNNFCGLGATGGGVKGASFSTPQLGARAHVQHLVAYATYNTPRTAIVDPRFTHITDDLPQIHGHINAWTGLNGIWAVPGTHYGQDILSLWQQALAPDASDESLQVAESKVRRAPQEAGNYIYRGIVFSKRGEHEKALQDFQQALKLSPQSTSARFDEALAFSALGRNKDAIKSYDKVTKQQPDCIAAWYNRGLLRLEDRKYDAAIRDFERAIKLEPRHINAMNNIAVARLRQEKYREAWETLQKAASTNTTNEYVLGNQFILQACQK
jgi:tetratricopeptide (TPR) repeat protein